MKYKIKYHFFIWILLISTNSVSSKTITLKTLLQELTNREHMAEYPSPNYVCKQFSSYDRASVTKNDKSWYSNWDRTMFVKTETNSGRKEYVMMDAKGPGAIVRFWMTFAGENSGKGTLRIYLDNNPIAAIEGSALDIISGGKLVGAPLSTSVSDLTDYRMRGHNLYLPIPYSKSCKITYQSENIMDFGAKYAGESVYYNIGYRIYDASIKVKTFSLNQLKKCKSTIDHTQKKLREKEFQNPQNSSTEIIAGNILPDMSKDLTITKKSAAIRKLTFKLDAKNIEQALRSTIIHISFDNNSTVACPIGDFMGTGYQIRNSNNWYAKIENDGTMSCYWVMPFKNVCKIAIENKGTQNVTISRGEITTSPYNWTNKTMYFGSYWKQFSFLKTGEMKNNEGDGGPFDINYVTLNGKGIYVGDCLTLFNTVYAWWGEGDEKVYVDNETFPSHFGTGSEDYYGYAWCRPEKFTNHPFIGQSDGSGNFNPGYTNILRFRSLDAIPFRKQIKFDMEMWHWTKAIINYAPITFWYISPDDVKMCPKSNLTDATAPVALKREDIISPVIKDNKIEGENMKLEKTSGGNFRYSNDVTKGWSNNMQLVWTDLKPSDKLYLSFISDTSININSTVKFTKAPGYGTFRIAINGQYFSIINASDKNFKVGSFNFEKISLKKGNNTIEIEFLPQSNNENKVGIDCIEFY